MKTIGAGCLIAILLCLFVGCSNKQNKDPLLSTYSEGESDGYSWKKRATHFDNSAGQLTKDLLLSTLWQDGMNLLVFFKDDRFKYGGYFSGVVTEGRFSINGDSVLLEPGINVGAQSSKTQTKTLTFGEKTHTFYSAKCLSVDGKEIFFEPQDVKRLMLPEGTQITLDGVQAKIHSEKIKKLVNLDAVFSAPGGAIVDIPQSFRKFRYQVYSDCVSEAGQTTFYRVVLTFDNGDPEPDGGGFPTVNGWVEEKALVK
jgi:hypothetical protein